MRFPITAIVGRRGFGKTAMMTAIGIKCYQEDYPIFANYHLEIPYTYMTLQELAELPPNLHDCVVLMDEFHMGADAYDFFIKRTRDITKLVTQIRKRRITFFFTTQYLSQVAKRIRDQVDYIYMMRPQGNGVFTAYITDPHLPYEHQIINVITEDLKPIFPFYDTDEMIDVDGSTNDSYLVEEELNNELIDMFEGQGA